MKARVEVRKLTHCMYVPYLEAGHTSSGEAMTMGRKTYVVLSMALLMKLRSGRTRCYKDKHTGHFQASRLGFHKNRGNILWNLEYCMRKHQNIQ